MDKLWTGRFKKPLSEKVNEFNASIGIDSRMFKEDITGSIAHAQMLSDCGIIAKDDADKIVGGLKDILNDIVDGSLAIDCNAEDIHSFVEGELTKRLGDAGKRLHTARSRNDQVALDTRMFVRGKIVGLAAEVRNLVKVLCALASEHTETIMAGYTHLQMAQPITFGEHLMAYAFMFQRDLDRLKDCYKRMNYSPLGSAALAGTTFPINRRQVASALGFDGVVSNSMDGVADRDFCVETAGIIAMIMMHLSRFSEEVILWSSWEFKYIELDDAYSTGSSIMPQKKNPDIAELVRGKTGRVYGNLTALLTLMKGLPLAYNKDMQEDKEPIFDSIDTALQCLPIFADMLKTMTVLKENMAKKAERGFINATDCADYLTKKGMPFRTAYKTVGEIVAYCIDNGKTLATLTQDEYKNFSDSFDADIYEAIDLKTCVLNRKSEGAPSPESVKKQIEVCLQKLAEIEL